MRDPYHRQQRLAYWIKRVNSDLEETDRVDVLNLIQNMQDRERAVLWIIRCVIALLLMRKQLGKPFRDARNYIPIMLKHGATNPLNWLLLICYVSKFRILN